MTSMQKRNALHLIAAGALSICATGLLGACSEKKAEFRGVDVTGAEYARDIPLTDHNGQPRHIKDFAGKVVSVRLYADKVRIVAESKVVADHERRFGRDQLICDPWHYLPVLEKKPGSLRNGAPFVEWDLPVPIQLVRDRVLKQPKGDRAFVELLLAAREVGLEALQVACELTLDGGVITAAVVMNELRRITAPPRPSAISLPDQLRLQVEPVADCSRYDRLRGGQYVH